MNSRDDSSISGLSNNNLIINPKRRESLVSMTSSIVKFKKKAN